MAQSPIANLGLSCPSGGDFYICQNSATRFVGCCGVDPCADKSGLCPTSQLYTSSFSSVQYYKLQPQACSSSLGLWYTCVFSPSTDTFMGCCGINPCQNKGCPASSLVPARLSDDPYEAAAFISDGDSSSVSSSTSAVLVSPPSVSPSPSTIDAPLTTLVSSSTPTSAPSSTQSSKPTSTAAAGASSSTTTRNGMSTGALIGIAVGCAVAVLAVGIAIFMCWWRKRKADKTNSGAQAEIVAHVQAHNGSGTDDSAGKPDTAQMAQYNPYRGAWSRFLINITKECVPAVYMLTLFFINIDSYQPTLVNPGSPYGSVYNPNSPPLHHGAWGQQQQQYHLGHSRNTSGETGFSPMGSPLPHQPHSTGAFGQAGWAGGSTHDVAATGHPGRYSVMSELSSDNTGAVERNLSNRPLYEMPVENRRQYHG